MNWTLFWTALTACELLVLWQSYLAWHDWMLFPSDLKRGKNKGYGLPFLCHGGMWGDVFIVSPLVAAIVGFFGAQWAPVHVVAAAAVGFGLSDFLHGTYKAGSFACPEAHVREGRLTGAGTVHFVYMGAAFAVLLLYYIRAMSADEYPHVLAVSTLLTIHVMIGNHVVLGLVAPSWYPNRPLESAGTWGAIAATAAVTFGRVGWLTFMGY